MTDNPRSSKQEMCVEMLNLIIDGQATDSQLEKFRQHMVECPPCYQTHELELAIKQTLQSKLDKKPVPPGLIELIKSKIRETV